MLCVKGNEMNPNALTDKERRDIEALQAYLDGYDAVYASALRRLLNENDSLMTEVITLNLMIDSNFCRVCHNNLKQCTCQLKDKPASINANTSGLCWDCEEEAVPGKIWCKNHGG